MTFSLRLEGRSTQISDIPQQCHGCGCRELYQQSDFKRSIGLSVVVIASLSTFVLMYMGFNWFVVWSPMFGALVFDRLFSWFSPVAVICYRCGLLHRGLNKQLAYQKFEAFDLEVHDRYKYAETLGSQ